MLIAERLDDSEHVPPLFKESDIWWCHLGDNIGTEISGKGDMFDRQSSWPKLSIWIIEGWTIS